LFIFLLASSISYSQQESQFVNAINNPYLLNPAAGGMTDVVQIDAITRTQWMGYNGGPRTLLFTANSQINIGKKNNQVLSEFNIKDESFFKSPSRSVRKVKHVVGGKASNDAIGPFGKTTIHGSYGIHLPFTKKMNVGVAIGIGWGNFRINEDRVILYQNDDAAYSEFLGNSSTQNYFDANAGVVLYSNRFYVGFSSSQVFKNDLVFADVSTESHYNRHFFTLLKYRFSLGDKIEFEPSALLKFAEQSPLSADFGAQFIYGSNVWLGAYYRTSNALVFQLGANLIKNLYFSYSYGHTTGAIQVASNATHEIQLGLYIGNNRNTKKEIDQNKKEVKPIPSNE